MLGLWMKLTVDTTLLGLEAQGVIGLRLAQIALGQGSPAEAQLMMTEKILALMDAVTIVATGGSAHAVVEDYRRRVQANARRLQTA
jgi:aromatic ring-opening dioxygenase catalytic subunit (LigB family)